MFVLGQDCRVVEIQISRHGCGGGNEKLRFGQRGREENTYVQPTFWMLSTQFDDRFYQPN